MNRLTDAVDPGVILLFYLLINLTYSQLRDNPYLFKV